MTHIAIYIVNGIAVAGKQEEGNGIAVSTGIVFTDQALTAIIKSANTARNMVSVAYKTSDCQCSEYRSVCQS
jgi:hypothetical protein